MSNALTKFAGKKELGKQGTEQLTQVRSRIGLGQYDPNAAEKVKSGHVGFVFDATASMEPYWDTARKGLNLLYSRLGELIPDLSTTFIAYRDYSNGELLVQRLSETKNTNAVTIFLDGIRCISNTDTPEAVEVGLEQILASEVAFAILVGDSEPHGVTDSFKNGKDYRKISQRLKEKGIPVYTVATHPDHGLCSSFRYIAETTGGQFFLLDNINDLIDVLSVAAARKVKKVNVLAGLLKREQGGQLTATQRELLNE